MNFTCLSSIRTITVSSLRVPVTPRTYEADPMGYHADEYGYQTMLTLEFLKDSLLAWKDGNRHPTLAAIFFCSGDYRSSLYFESTTKDLSRASYGRIKGKLIPFSISEPLRIKWLKKNEPWGFNNLIVGWSIYGRKNAFSDLWATRVRYTEKMSILNLARLFHKDFAHTEVVQPLRTYRNYVNYILKLPADAWSTNEPIRIAVAKQLRDVHKHPLVGLAYIVNGRYLEPPIPGSSQLPEIKADANS